MLLSTLWAAPGTAHELPRERTLLVQAGVDRLEMMVIYLEPPGRSVELLMSRFDFDGDGELLGEEADLAGREWIARALGGLQFEVEGEKPRPEMPDIKFERTSNGGLSAAVYARWDLPALDPDRVRRIHVRLHRNHETVPTELNARPGLRTAIARLDLPPRFVGAPRLPVLRPGESATIFSRLDDQPTPADDARQRK
ncbi:MAG: hypothetical protein ACOCV2_06255 [Persicimonas sp.]